MKRPAFPTSLRGRLILTFSGLIVLAMLVLAATLPGLAREHQVATLEEGLADEARLVGEFVVAELSRDSSADLDQLAKRLGRNADTRITIIGPDGTVLGESHQDLSQVGNHAQRREFQQALAGRPGADIHYSETVRYAMLYVAVPIEREGKIVGVSRVARALADVDRRAANLTYAILLAALAGGLLATLAAVLAARAITTPLARLSTAAVAVAADPARVALRLHGGGPSEVVQLGNTIDRLAEAAREGLRRVAGERDRLDAVLDNLADGIVIADRQGKVTRINRAAERLTAIRWQEGADYTLPEVLRDHELVDFVERARAAGPAAGTATTFHNWRNPRRFLRAAVRTFGSGSENQTLILLQDLTELQRLETVRRDFVANVSHELRTPISAIRAMAETLADGAVDDPPVARDFLRRIEQEVDGLHRLVEELLELSRLESGRVHVLLAPTDVRHLIVEAVRRLAPMAERASVALTVEVPGGLPAVFADADRMGQVLVNLIHNAVKFTPPGGSIVVRARLVDGKVHFTVADTGVGVATEMLPRIFERFYKADQARAGGGTGLGLAIAKHTVQLHSGRIWAESPGPGRGTSVHIALPATETSE